jgi:ABC-type Mn2+/Zn2+ transport system ATPase subunit
MAPPLIQLKDIALTFGGTPLLSGVELSVSAEERVCLIGRNGSGKSTLLKIAAGLVESDFYRAFRIRAPRAGEHARFRRGARHRVEQRALARVRHADQGDAQAPLAAEQGRAQGDGSFVPRAFVVDGR